MKPIGELVRFLAALEEETVDLKSLGLRGNLEEIVCRIEQSYVSG